MRADSSVDRITRRVLANKLLPVVVAGQPTGIGCRTGCPRVLRPQACPCNISSFLIRCSALICSLSLSQYWEHSVPPPPQVTAWLDSRRRSRRIIRVPVRYFCPLSPLPYSILCNKTAAVRRNNVHLLTRSNKWRKKKQKLCWKNEKSQSVKSQESAGRRSWLC